MAKITAKRYREQTCCGTIQDAKFKARSAKANRNKPQPWILLKMAVGISIAIIGYTGYVYIGRLCVPMLLKQQNALGGRALGGESQEFLFIREAPNLSSG
jgi:palmitoyltransferase